MFMWRRSCYWVSLLEIAILMNLYISTSSNFSTDNKLLTPKFGNKTNLQMLFLNCFFSTWQHVPCIVSPKWHFFCTTTVFHALLSYSNWEVPVVSGITIPKYWILTFPLSSSMTVYYIKIITSEQTKWGIVTIQVMLLSKYVIRALRSNMWVQNFCEQPWRHRISYLS